MVSGSCSLMLICPHRSIVEYQGLPGLRSSALSLPVEVAISEAAETAIKSRRFIYTFLSPNTLLVCAQCSTQEDEIVGASKCQLDGQTIVKPTGTRSKSVLLASDLPDP